MTGPAPGGPRRRPDPVLGVVAGLAFGMLLTWLHHPRVGMYAIGATLVGATVLRAVLPPRDAGLLVVRGRVVDVVTLSVLSAAVLALATVTPFPPPAS